MRRLAAATLTLLIGLGAVACAAPTKPGGGAATTVAPLPADQLPARPAGWPSTLELGVFDGAGGAADLRAKHPGMGFRYQYLAGGVNTGNGWATWNPGGDFVRFYVQDSRAHGFVPVFTYYMMFQSNPGASQGEADGVYTNLTNAATMAAYYADLKLLFQKAAQGGGTTVLHVEPDLWAYLQQRAPNDDPTALAAKVSGSGFADVAGLPDTVAGFAQAIVRLRDQYGPNVLLAFHASPWATGEDFLLSDPSDDQAEAIGDRTGQFYARLGARFDLAFMDVADRDAAFKQAQYGDGGSSWMNPDDYRRVARWTGGFVRTARLRMVVWQIPFGNTKMRAENNTWNHYQDNKVEWWLDDPSRANLQSMVGNGVIAFLFGRGADGPTCACDANGDGVTNPAPINGNNRTSLNADDDGGFFWEKANAYDTAGAIALP